MIGPGTGVRVYVASGVTDMKSTCSPIAKEALDRISKLYDIERMIKSKTKDQRQALHDTKSRPLTESLKTWLEARLKELPEKFKLTSAINYGLSRWVTLTSYAFWPGFDKTRHIWV